MDRIFVRSGGVDSKRGFKRQSPDEEIDCPRPTGGGHKVKLEVETMLIARLPLANCSFDSWANLPRGGVIVFVKTLQYFRIVYRNHGNIGQSSTLVVRFAP